MSREVIEGVQEQGADESIQYQLTVTPAPTSVTAVKVYDAWRDGSDVTATVMPAGTASINGAVITLPNLTALTEGGYYRVEVRYTDGVNVVEPFFRVRCK